LRYSLVKEAETSISRQASTNKYLLEKIKKEKEKRREKKITGYRYCTSSHSRRRAQKEEKS
jgi:hypothetical protein